MLVWKKFSKSFLYILWHVQNCLFSLIFDFQFQHNVEHPKKYRLHNFSPSEKYLNLSSPIHSFWDSAGWGPGAAASRRAFDRNVSELGRVILRCLCCFSEGRTACAELYARESIWFLILTLAYNSVQTVRLSENSKNKASQNRPPKLDFISVKPFWKQPPRCATPAESRKRPSCNPQSWDIFRPPLLKE